MIIPSHQMSHYHSLIYTDRVKITCNNKTAEKVKECTLVGLIIDKNFEWNSYSNSSERHIPQCEHLDFKTK